MPNTIIYLVPPKIQQDVATRRLIIKELDAVCVPVDTIQDLICNLGDPHYRADLILLDLEYLYNFEGSSAFELLSTLNTFCKCTLYRSGDKTTKRKIKVAALVSDHTSIDAIRDFMTLPDTCGFVPYSFASNVTMADIKTAIDEILEGNTHIPNLVRDRLRSTTKKKRDSSIISLTPRESQILTIIRERGASNKIIAKMLNISESTVKLHIGKVLKKYGVKNRTQLAVFSRNA